MRLQRRTGSNTMSENELRSYTKRKKRMYRAPIEQNIITNECSTAITAGCM